MENITHDYLLGKKIRLFQKKDAYKTSSDAVLLAASVDITKENAKILDVGAGVGGVSLCLAYRYKKADITGFEIQKDLANLANLNAKENGFDHVKYICQDIASKKMPCPFCSFDVVVTNPPYAKDGTKSPNISKALAHLQQNITLKQWIAFCIKMLKPKGKLYLINRAEALDDILSALSPQMGGVTVLPIYSKQNDKAKRIIITAQKDSKSPLKILPPLYLRDNNGYTKYTEDILRGRILSLNDAADKI